MKFQEYFKVSGVFIGFSGGFTGSRNVPGSFRGVPRCFSSFKRFQKRSRGVPGHFKGIQERFRYVSEGFRRFKERFKGVPGDLMGCPWASWAIKKGSWAFGED